MCGRSCVRVWAYLRRCTSVCIAACMCGCLCVCMCGCMCVGVLVCVLMPAFLSVFVGGGGVCMLVTRPAPTFACNYCAIAKDCAIST